MLDEIFVKAPVFLLVFVRCFAMFLTLPLFSMRTVSRAAKIALAGYITFFIFNSVDYSLYSPYLTDEGSASLMFVLLLIGEGLIGVILGFYVTIIFAAFSTAGQFTAFQMGLSAASSYDALSQIENPLMGQFFNFIAMLIFLQTKWFQKLFLGGLVKSYDALNALSIVTHQNDFLTFFLSGLTKLFGDAIIIALPVMGTLLMITVCTGLLSKAAPQMNLLSEGFPIMMLVAYFIIMVSLPSMINFFERSFYHGFLVLEQFFTNVSGGIS